MEITYDYLDENQTVLYSKVKTIQEGGSKSFFWKRKENGIEVNNLTGCKKVLFNLPLISYGISKNLPIFVVEGEKDVKTLRAQNLVATTTPTSLEWNKEYTHMLQAADVVVLYDNDKTGIKRKELICKHLYGHTKRLRVIDLPGLEYREKHGLDITDWFEQGHSKAELLDLLNNTPDYTPPHDTGGVVAVNFKQLIYLEIKKPEVLLSPFLWSQGLVLLYAKRGVGKTHLALGIAYAVAIGGSFLKWHASQPRKVLYIDGEMSAYSMQDRLKKMNTTEHELGLLEQNLSIITPDLQSTAMPNLSSQKGRELIEKFIDDKDLIIIDNLSSLFRSGSENEAESWMPVQEWALDLRRREKTILFVHHAGKSGLQRGTSKREDALDVIIGLRHSDNYQAQEGARFEVHFEKTRHFAGEDAEPFQAQLFTDEVGHTKWEISDVDTDPEVAHIANMRKEGKTYVEIMGTTQLTKSQVETRINKARQAGLI